MTDFIQMDIFFFIASVCAVILLFVIATVGVYVVLIIHKVKKIIKEVEKFALYTAENGKETITVVKDKIEEVLNKGGIVERVVATVLGTLLAKTFQKRGKIKRDAPKR